MPLANDSIPAGTAPNWEMIRNIPVDDLINQLATRVVHFAIQLAIAVTVFYIGRFFIKKLHTMLGAIFLRRHVDPSLATFLLSVVRIALYFILFVTVIGILGIETSSFIALFASAGVAVGMALSGTLQNFAGGVLILLLKPYRVGNYIEAQGYAGTVREIQIFNTVITTPDNKAIIIPNGGLSTGSINNWSKEDYRRIDWSVSVAYGNKLDVVEPALLEILRSDVDVVKSTFADDRAERQRRGTPIVTQDDDESCEDDNCAEKKPGMFTRLRNTLIGHRRAAQNRLAERVQKVIPPSEFEDRTPTVVLTSLGASSVDLAVRAWVPTTLYWPVYYRIYKRIYSELPRAGIEFPFPQLDVHLNPGAPESAQH